MGKELEALVHGERALNVSVTNGYAGKKFDPTVYRDPIVVNRVADGQQTPLFHYEEHSPAGFSWGVVDDGAADLALSILIDFVGDEDVAAFLYQKFKADFVVKFADEWELDGSAIAEWVGTHYLRTKDKVDVEGLDEAGVADVVRTLRAGEQTEYATTNLTDAINVVRACMENNVATAIVPMFPRYPDKSFYEVRVLGDQINGIISPWTVLHHSGASILTTEKTPYHV